MNYLRILPTILIATIPFSQGGMASQQGPTGSPSSVDTKVEVQEMLNKAPISNDTAAKIKDLINRDPAVAAVTSSATGSPATPNTAAGSNMPTSGMAATNTGSGASNTIVTPGATQSQVAGASTGSANGSTGNVVVAPPMNQPHNAGNPINSTIEAGAAPSVPQASAPQAQGAGAVAPVNSSNQTKATGAAQQPATSVPAITLVPDIASDVNTLKETTKALAKYVDDHFAVIEQRLGISQAQPMAPGQQPAGSSTPNPAPAAVVTNATSATPNALPAGVTAASTVSPSAPAIVAHAP